MHTLLLVAALTLQAPQDVAGLAESPALPADLLTVAEASAYKATATHAEVTALMERLAERADYVHLDSIGTTSEGRSIPVAIIAQPPVRTAEQARASGKPIVFAFGDIHAGEVCGKEALLMLARELVLDPDHPLLDELVLAIAPIYNGDGNDRMAKDNRPGQDGPDDGMGERPNAMGLDLNRDWMKLESPEAQAMVRFLTEWDPHVVIDTHTTNGSHHRYVLTWAPPLNTAADGELVSFVRDELLATVSKRLLEHTGYDSFPYGNFNRAMDTWSTYSSQPRYGGPYRGLRGHFTILSEAYSYAPYRDRVLATLEFVREIATYAAERRADVVALHAAVRERAIAAGAHPRPDDLVPLRHRLEAASEPTVVKGWRMVDHGDRRPRPVDEPRDYPVVMLDRFAPTLSVRRPHAYVIAPGQDAVVEKLHQHGIATRSFDSDEPIRVERYIVTAVQRARRAFQGHRNVLLEVESAVEHAPIEPGSTLVPLDQPLGTLAAVLLEPQSDDGLAAWNFLDESLEVGRAYPIVRVASPADLPRR